MWTGPKLFIGVNNEKAFFSESKEKQSGEVQTAKQSYFLRTRVTREKFAGKILTKGLERA